MGVGLMIEMYLETFGITAAHHAFFYTYDLFNIISSV